VDELCINEAQIGRVPDSVLQRFMREPRGLQ
jgi:hypothetical protein